MIISKFFYKFHLHRISSFAKKLNHRSTSQFDETYRLTILLKLLKLLIIDVSILSIFMTANAILNLYNDVPYLKTEYNSSKTEYLSRRQKLSFILLRTVAREIYVLYFIRMGFQIL